MKIEDQEQFIRKTLKEFNKQPKNVQENLITFCLAGIYIFNNKTCGLK